MSGLVEPSTAHANQEIGEVRPIPLGNGNARQKGRHSLSDEERRRGLQASLSEESRAKRQETRWRKRRELNTRIIDLYEQGMVPLGIANQLDTSVRRVAEVIRREGYVIAPYLTTS